MELQEVMLALEELGSEQTKKVLTRHGAREPFYGVKVGDLKKLIKPIKHNHELAVELYKTGVSDAMYLAGLIEDETQVTKAQLQTWMNEAYWYMLSEYVVAQLAADSPYGWELGMEWIESRTEGIAAGGWATLSNVVSITDNSQLDEEILSALLDRIATYIHSAPNRVRYAMNGFVIACGSYVPSLTSKAIATANKIGKVDVEMGGTSCKVPLARDYIEKVINADKIGKKRKVARC